MNVGSACTFISLDEVVATYMGRPKVDYQTDISRIAQYYGAGILQEGRETIITEDAEVVSVETVKKA